MYDGTPTDLRDQHARLVELFETAEDSSRTNRQKAERDIDYYDGKQWTSKEVAELAKRGQPAITKNRIKRKIKYLQGLERAQRTVPKAVPRAPKSEEDSNTATAVLRYVTDQQRYNQTRSRCFKDLSSAGWGGPEITVGPGKGGNPRVTVTRCQWDRMFWDPFSQEEDYSDATYLGLVLWMDRTEAIARYGEAAGRVFDETLSAAGQVGGTFDDKPRETTWVNAGKRRRIRVVQMYHLNAGDWWFCEFTKGGYLTYGPSPWLDEDGKTEHPYAWGSANIDRDNNRYGEIREMVDTQDSVNKRESKMLHLVSVRQTFGSDSLLGTLTTKQMRQELAKPDGHISLAPNAEWGKNFGIIETNDMAQGQFQLLQEAKAEMDVMGPNAAMAGKDPRQQSGRAIIAQQQGGEIEIGTLTDALRDMDHRVYRKIWNRVRQFWTEQEFVSVTDDPNTRKWVGVNQPVIDPMTKMPVIDPSTGQPFMSNAVAELDVDITMGDAPPVGTMQDEEFGKMVDLAKVVPALQALPAPIWIEMSNLRNKGDIIQKLQQAQQPDPMAEEAKQVALAQEQAKVGKTKADTLKSFSDAMYTMGKTMHPIIAPTEAMVGPDPRRQQHEIAMQQSRQTGRLN